jgi:hypothetical protein
MLSKGNISLYPTTLIESNAMKRLISLVLSAALLYPMWATAQTTPTIAGTLNWTLNPGIRSGYETVVTNIPGKLYNFDVVGCEIDSGVELCGEIGIVIHKNVTVRGFVRIKTLNASIVDNGNNNYSLTGTVTAEVRSNIGIGSITTAGWGSMYLSDNVYIMTVMSWVPTAEAELVLGMNCTLSPATLDGTCIGKNGRGSQITLVK